MLIISYSQTDVGRKRNHNEDFHFADDVLGLYIVADGVGGQARGEVASKEAVEQVHNWVLSHRSLIENYKKTPEESYVFKIRRMLESGIQSACYMVFGISDQIGDGRKMATTMSVALFIENVLFIGQVGDSRIYRLREGEILQLTEDHTLLNYKLKQGLITPEEAVNFKKKNVITRAVGHMDYVEPDIFHYGVESGDRYLLCSDGLHGYFHNLDEIAEILSDELPSVPGKFIELANSRGGKDNITAIVLELF